MIISEDIKNGKEYFNEENVKELDITSTSTGYLGGLKYSKLLKEKKGSWKVLFSEVKKYDPKNPIIKAMLKTISMGFYIPLYFFHLIKGNHKKYTYKIVSYWGKSLIKIAKINLEIIGSFEIEKDRPYLFIANHTSPYDIPIIYSTLPILAGFVANKEISKMPVMNFWMRKANSIFVDIYDQKSKIATLKEIVKTLNQNKNLIIFPEGKMSPDGNLQPFQRGGLKAAEIANAIIIPIALIGVRNVILPGGFTLNENQKVRVCFGKPIDVSKMQKDEKLKLDQITFEQLNCLINNNLF